MFDANELLKPISDSAMYGEDISFSPEIDAIMEARRFDDASLDQGVWVTEMKKANWPVVIDQCSSLIATKSKDLRLAVWLTEASAKVCHFAGLAEGYLLLAGLCDRFWEGMYPLPNDGDLEQRIGNIHWILSRSMQLVKEIPMTEGRNTAFSMMDFEAARAYANNLERSSSSENERADGKLKLSDLEAARAKSSKKFYEKLLNDVKHCLASLQQLEQSVDARLGIEGPSFFATREAIENSLNLITRFANDAGVQTNTLQQNDPLTNLQNNQATESVAQTVISDFNGQIQTRAQAITQLRAVAEFFRRTEPHSPVAYLADKAAHWGEIPLHTWLSTVIKDPVALSSLEELLGVAQNKTEITGN